MDPAIAEFLKLYGPLSLGWVFFGIQFKRNLDRDEKETEAKIKLAVVLETLVNLVKDHHV